MEHKFCKARVVYSEEAPGGSGIFHLRLKCEMEAKPGQFLLIHPGAAVPSTSVMPRPFSILLPGNGRISALIKVVGPNTEIYSRLQENDTVLVSGPHGRPYLPNLGYDEYVLVGGGIGAAALHLVGEYLRRQRREVTLLIGGKDRKTLVNTDLFDKCACDTQVCFETDPKKCNQGIVTDLLRRKLVRNLGLNVLVIACGPKPMLRAVAELAAEYHQDCHVMLEEIMACGVGSCKGCAVFGTEGDVKHVCTDGPVFNAAWIDWDKLMPKPAPSLPISRRTNYPLRTVLTGPTGHKLELKYPVMNASGCLGIEAIETGQVDVRSAGALVTKGIALLPRFGNASPRLCELPDGMINSIGLEGPGIDKFIRDELPRWLKFRKPVIVNISGFSPEDYAEVAKRLAPTKIAAIEENVSCPNIKQGNSIFGLSADITGEITSQVRAAAPGKFLIVKLSPMASNIVQVAQAAVAAGADAISVINTLTGMAIDVRTRRIALGNPQGVGGVSGPAIHAVAVRIVYQLAQARLGVPIIGIGGVRDGWTAAELILAGASAVEVGTELFPNPWAIPKINNGLSEILIQHRADRIKDLVGQAFH